MTERTRRKPLSKTDLEVMTARGCQMPGCKDSHCGKEMFFHSHCHPSAGTWVNWSNERHTLQVLCRACRAPMCEILVAEVKAEIDRQAVED
jgi:hypothetical protein